MRCLPSLPPNLARFRCACRSWVKLLRPGCQPVSGSRSSRELLLGEEIARVDVRCPPWAPRGGRASLLYLPSPSPGNPGEPPLVRLSTPSLGGLLAQAARPVTLSPSRLTTQPCPSRLPSPSLHPLPRVALPLHARVLSILAPVSPIKRDVIRLRPPALI